MSSSTATSPAMRWSSTGARHRVRREWRRLPVVTYLTRSNFSLTVQALGGVTPRRRHPAAARSSSPVCATVRQRHADLRADLPHLRRQRAGSSTPCPSRRRAADGELLQGHPYILAPAFCGLDYVDAGARPEATSTASSTSSPTPPTPPIRCLRPTRRRATRSPTPSSPPMPATALAAAVPDLGAGGGHQHQRQQRRRRAMVVLPNTDPSVESVLVAATAPVPGMPYAGLHPAPPPSAASTTSTARSSRCSPSSGQEGASGAAVHRRRRWLVTRPAGGWGDAPSRTAPSPCRSTIAEGTALYAVRDRGGLQRRHGATESERLPVSDDAAAAGHRRLLGAPRRRAGRRTCSSARSSYFELRAHDVETAIQTVTWTSTAATSSPRRSPPPSAGYHRPLPQRQPDGADGGPRRDPDHRHRDHVADWGGNTVDRSHQLDDRPRARPDAPEARWKAPWQGALWPADYTSRCRRPDGGACCCGFYARDTNPTSTATRFPASW